MKKIIWVVVIILAILISIPIFPPAGQFCPAMPGSGCSFHKESALEFFIIRGNSIKDLKYIKDYEAEQKRKEEDLEKFLAEEKAKLPDLTIAQINEELANAKNENIQNITIGKYNGIPIVIQRDSEPLKWDAFYAGGEGVTEEKCLQLGGRVIRFENTSKSYRGCSPI